MFQFHQRRRFCHLFLVISRLCVDKNWNLSNLLPLNDESNVGHIHKVSCRMLQKWGEKIGGWLAGWCRPIIIPQLRPSHRVGLQAECGKNFYVFRVNCLQTFKFQSDPPPEHLFSFHETFVFKIYFGCPQNRLTENWLQEYLAISWIYV